MSKNKYSASNGPDWFDVWETLHELHEDGYSHLDIRLVRGKNVIGERIFTWEVREHGVDNLLSSQRFLDRYPTSSATAAGGLYAALHGAWNKLEEKVKK